ncbi:hypothetical protein HAL013_12130 [Helicobacter ailurogastricus]|uniref:Uncharacterized protein n=1 Tax=Helicobacter ailurogastricus TaxID=1578720 RepID=A0A0K2X8K8_9HELI|nr:hypothetical protein HAL011_13270 [Helicobacter ailurogastricus]CRF42996.1 hypothetical protein HAL013_12130 [Helicobacter ailurogastricus]CRF43725.1 hypothetical protein HAL09_02740 [Helicobacter ailurogastricus]
MFSLPIGLKGFEIKFWSPQKRKVYGYGVVIDLFWQDK